MSRIGQLFNQAVLDEEIELLLGTLARNTHLLCNLGGCLFLANQRDSAENLPAGTGQPEWRGECISPLQHLPIGLEKRDNGLRDQSDNLCLHVAGLTAIGLTTSFLYRQLVVNILS